MAQSRLRAPAGRAFERVTAAGDAPDWAGELARAAARLSRLAEDGAALREHLLATVRRTRELLDLPPAPDGTLEAIR